MTISNLRWRINAHIRRFRRAWHYAMNTLTEDDASTMRYECTLIEGLYPLECFTRDGVMEACRDRFGDDPALVPLVEAACCRVHSKWSGSGDAAGTAEDWAMDLIQEYARQDRIALTDSWANAPEMEPAD